MPTLDELLGGVPSIFWANRPSGPGSYDELQSRRKIAQAMLAKRSPFPQNVGQGLTYVGEKIGDVAMLRDIERRDVEDEARQAKQVETMKEIYRRNQNQPPSGQTSTETLPPTVPARAGPTTPAALTPNVSPAAPTPVATPTPPPTDPRAQITRAITDRAFRGSAGPYSLRPVTPPANVVPLDPAATSPDPLVLPGDFPPSSFDPSFRGASGAAGTPMPTTVSASSGVPPTSVPMPPPRPVYDRTRINAEVQADPTLIPRMRTIIAGETRDPREQQIIGETIANRATARGQPLAQVMQQYTGPGSSGYYPASTFGRGQASPDIADAVLRGSDVGGQALGFAPTGNASGGVAARGIASGRYNAAGRLPGGTGETFVQQEPPAQLQRLAGTRLGEGGGGGGGAGGPSGNPPIITNIPPAPPASVAQLRPGSGGPLPGPFDPRQPEPVPQSAGGIVQRQPDFTLPPAPVAPPMSEDEINAMTMARRSGNPREQQGWLDLANALKTQREQALAREKTVWDSIVRSHEAAKLERDKAGIEQQSPKYQQDLARAQFELSQAQKKASEGLPVKDVIELLKPEYENKITGSMNAAEAIKEARRYVPDMFSGKLAEFNLQAAKTAVALSPAGTFPELEKRVQATEKYRAIANQLAGALRPVIAGNNQQSNAELDRILESAAVGAPTEANTRLEILNNIGRSNFLNIHRFQERAAGLAGGDENRQRDILHALPTRMETQIPESTIAKLQRNYRESPTQQTLDHFNQEFFTPGLAQQLLKTHGMGQ